MKEFYPLFESILLNTATLAERAMENSDGRTKEEMDKAEAMRDDLMGLRDKLARNEDLTFADINKIYVGCFLTVEMLKQKISTIQVVINSYEESLIPALRAVVDNKDWTQFGKFFPKSNT